MGAAKPIHMPRGEKSRNKLFNRGDPKRKENQNEKKKLRDLLYQVLPYLNSSKNGGGMAW